MGYRLKRNMFKLKNAVRRIILNKDLRNDLIK